jgi:hypothetical protein
MRILLLNPPAPHLLLRDYYCAETAKADYLWPPLDLLLMSGALKDRSDVCVLDAVAEGLGADAALSRVQQMRPDWIIALVGGFRLDLDMAFLRRAADLCSAPLILSGDIPRFDPVRVLKRYPWVHGTVQDFADPSLADYFLQAKDTPALVLRDHPCAPSAASSSGVLHYPLPGHELFPLSRYRLALLAPHGRPITCVLTRLGCPFRCRYCAFPSLPRRERPLADILAEWDHLERLGVRGIFVRDLTLGPSRERILELSGALAGRGGRIPWVCEARLELLDRECLEAMRDAGCRCILFGLESPDADRLRAMDRPSSPARILENAAACRALGIRTLAHMMYGFPGESWGESLRTLRCALSIPVDFLSWNRYVPRFGSLMRSDLAGRSMTDEGEQDLDVSLPKSRWRWLLPLTSALFYLHPRRARLLLRLLGLRGILAQMRNLWQRTFAPPSW